MLRKIFLQNKTFFIIVAIAVAFFGFVLYGGVKRIYDRESKWRHGIGSDQLVSSKVIIRSFFSNFEHHLTFLKEFPATKEYVNSNFKSNKFLGEVENLFYNFAKVSKAIHRIEILDTTGQEVVSIYNKRDRTIVSGSRSRLQDKKSPPYFQEALKYDGQVYISPIAMNVESIDVDQTVYPVVRLATQLYDDKSQKRGVLVLHIDFSKVLGLLPKNVFVQTQKGNTISLNPDKSVAFDKSKYMFKDREGQIKISDTENIHYSALELAPDTRLIVGIYHNHIGLKVSLQKLIFMSAILIIVFMSLIGGISYISISRYHEKNRAQRALIFSLVELTDWRDHETGDHLQRTKNYSKALARQLGKNKKYRKIITDEFIKDIFDTAPLHDIGKVGIKDSILLKAGRLTDDEFEEMKQHVRIGKQVVQDIIDNFDITESFILTAKNICASHHEKYNGRGYPEGLKADQIPLEARIFALADVYDALRSKRSYKDGLPHAEVVRIIRSESAEHFDPDIVEAFLMCEKKFVEITGMYV
jgi:putative two-component system response regulator